MGITGSVFSELCLATKLLMAALINKSKDHCSCHIMLMVAEVLAV